MNGMPVGLAMYTSTVTKGITASLIKFNAGDSREKKLLKYLASTMISLNPRDRPTICEVLQELKDIASRFDSVYRENTMKCQIWMDFIK